MIHTYLITVTVFASLSIWKIHGQESNLTTSTNSATSIKPTTNYSYEALGFNTSAVRSGPILLIDKKTIFISNLHYDAAEKGSYFWAGSGVPSTAGVLVPDENNSTGTLQAYRGQNIYLQLPGNVTVDKIDYLGIWSTQRKTAIGYVMLYPKDRDDVRDAIPEARGLHRRTEDNKTIFRVPACCGPNEISNYYRNSSEIHYKVYASNETHIDPDVSLTDIKFIPYSYDLKCPPKYTRLGLESDSISGFLFNTSLIYVYGHLSGVLLHDKFCIRNVSDPLILVCVTTPPPASNLDGASIVPNLYFCLLIISTGCFLLSALCYLFILKAKDVHQKCFIGYSISMTITFLSLIFMQKFNDSGTCGFMGSIFSFSTLCSFVWLTCLCIDLIFIVKSYERYSYKTRIYFYIGSSLIIPLIFLIASLAPDGWPDVPKSFVKMNLQNGSCDFSDANVAILFTPIAILILASLIALVYTSYIINTHDETNDYDWIRNKSQFKFMSRSCFLIWVTSLIWLVEAVVKIALMDQDYGVQIALDLIEASQGIFVAFIFVLNKYTRRDILRVLERKRHRQEREMQYNDLLKRLNQNRESNGTTSGGARAENEHG